MRRLRGTSRFLVASRASRADGVRHRDAERAAAPGRLGGPGHSGVVAVAAAGAVAGWRAGVFSPAASTGEQGAPAPATAAVTRQDLTATTPENATLGYGGVVHGDRAGRRDADLAAAAGQVIRQGQVLSGPITALRRC